MSNALFIHVSYPLTQGGGLNRTGAWSRQFKLCNSVDLE